ncbi:PilT/PilU family type 4a pilus ATPase [Lachnospiraceae bacterium JLR.KK008]
MAITIEEILAEAVQAGASDVHVAAQAQPMMRINGKLTAMSYPKLFSEDVLALLISVMTETQRRLYEERGEYGMAFEVRKLGRFRVNAYKQRENVALALRLIGSRIPSPEELGIPQQVMELRKKKRGLVLAAGEVGSGRTTTLAAVVDRINSTRATHIVTLEAPVEYVYVHKRSIVTQREVGIDCASYEAGLRAAMRQDADVIFAGELRDAGAVDAAIAVAESGRLVLSTANTPDIASAIERMVDIFPIQRQQQIRKRLSAALEMVISQRFLESKAEDRRKVSFSVLQVTDPVRELICREEMDALPIWQQREEVGGATKE